MSGRADVRLPICVKNIGFARQNYSIDPELRSAGHENPGRRQRFLDQLTWKSEMCSGGK